MKVLYFVVLVAVIVMELVMADDRSRAKAKDFPACYRDSTAATNGYTACSNPLYNPCHNYLCCGPDHECCHIVGTYNAACCRIDRLNVYEITGIVTGAVAWLGNLIVIFTCITPQILRKIKRRFFRPNKVMPSDRGGPIEMKHRGGLF